MLLVLIECLINGLMLVDLYVCGFFFDFFFTREQGVNLMGERVVFQSHDTFSII